MNGRQLPFPGEACNVRMVSANKPKPRYQQIIDSLSSDILSGRVKQGAKLPSEASLVRKFETSRITVGRAVRELQKQGLVESIAGSGTYVRRAASREQSLLFGLLIPDLGETEIFDPICRGIASAPESGDHALLWGHTDPDHPAKDEQCWALARQFISRKAAGVFFAPLEFEANAAKANRKILCALKQEGIPVVLLDRRPWLTPERDRADLVGINNRQAGYLATEHLVGLGCKRIGFIAYQGAASTISGRMAGYQDALRAHGLAEGIDSVLRIAPEDERVAIGGGQEMEAFVCVNDRVAGLLMHTFLARGFRIPEDVRLVGIDDVAYANLLPVPLTTIRQPCREIGAAAMRAMLERVDQPRLPAREVLLDGELIVRKSCGAR